MRKWLIAVGLVVSMGQSVYAQTKAAYSETVNNYIARYRELAIAEQKRTGIPAAIKLAQGIHETVAGTSPLSVNANNHFGIKCKKSWTGETYAHTDDAPNECFRKYPSSEASYLDHSDYLSKSPRYAGLFKLSMTDYAAWAVGLRAAGYATNPKYAQALIKIIEDYRLQEYTYAALGNDLPGTDVAKEIVPEHDAPVARREPAMTIIPAANITPVEPVAIQAAETATPVTQIEEQRVNTSATIKVDEGKIAHPPYGQQTRVNGLKAVYAKKGDTPLEYAFKFDIRYERLLEMNDISDKPLPFDMYLYLERKHFTAERPSRTVKQGETLLQIAQEEGVQLKFLRAMNMLEPGEEPYPGTVLELQHRAKEKPRVAITGPSTPQTPAIPPVVAKAEPVAEEAKVEPVATEPIAQEEPKQVEKLAGQSVPAAALIKEMAKEAEPVKEPEVVAATTVETAPSAPTRVATVPAAQPKATEPEKPADELDALKAKFDRFVYTKNGNITTGSEEEATQLPTQASAKPKPAAESRDAQYYVVKKGDTAFSIAKRNNITMKQLMDWNNLNFETIKVGQKLKVQ